MIDTANTCTAYKRRGQAIVDRWGAELRRGFDWDDSLVDASAYMDDRDAQTLRQRIYYLRNREKCLEATRRYKKRMRDEKRRLREEIRRRVG